jgi:putative SOS response-associated peptidase YedK
MCFSAKVWADYRLYTRKFGARIDIHEFVRLFEQREAGAKIFLPREVTDIFKLDPQTREERHCRELILRFEAAEATRTEELLFEQRRRLADAERTLTAKITKKAANDKRVATNKIASALDKLAELKLPARAESEGRIYPGWHAPVMTMDRSGNYLVSPQRYRCRPEGKPAFYDEKYPGTYNARRDSLGGYWKGQFGSSHAIVMASAFFENVKRHRLEARDLAEGEKEENVVLRFAPDNGQHMLVACLWSRWIGAGEGDLLSFAAITDEPPLEVAAAGHDRCIIPVKPANLPAWLRGGAALADYNANLDDRERPFYAHLLAA